MVDDEFMKLELKHVSQTVYFETHIRRLESKFLRQAMIQLLVGGCANYDSYLTPIGVQAKHKLGQKFLACTIDYKLLAARATIAVEVENVNKQKQWSLDIQTLFEKYAKFLEKLSMSVAANMRFHVKWRHAFV